MLPVVHHPAYRLSSVDGQTFRSGKFARLAEVLIEEGIVAADGFYEPDPATLETISAAHDAEYVQAVFDCTLDAASVRRIGLPLNPWVVMRSRTAAAGTVLAARLALKHGVGCNTAGGSHHAARAYGAGYCVFNDVAVAASLLLDEGVIRRALVVDLDVHQGDGTASIFAGDPRVFTFSMHAEKNFPARKIAGDLDVELPDGADDGVYLRALAEHLPELIEQVRPDLVFYNAGVDPHVSDRLGRLALTDEGLARRDAYVLDRALSAGVPVAGVIGGGYQSDDDALARRHATLHRAAAAAFRRL
jgi:acetoin utilization deacetylase AcuC-like enzyme